MRVDGSFTQWTRAKSCPTFGAIGPVIADDFNPDDARIIAKVNGQTLQDYPVADMIFSPRQIVSAISQDMLLLPGDIIACGTSVGAQEMPDNCILEVIVEGLGVLRNSFSG